MTTTKSAQTGSIGSVVMLAVIAGLIWWQWDWIAGMFGGGSSVAEASGFNCSASNGRTNFDGNVRNIGKEPMEFVALVNINDTTGRRIETKEVPVRPAPVPPQQGGSFRGDGPAIPDGGSCRLDNILNPANGMPVPFRRR
jgi:hypothetical protein